MSERDTLACPSGGCAVERIFTPSSVPFGRIDAAGEDVTDPARVADGSASWNMGLPGKDTVVGTRANGKPALQYRPISNREVGSNANAREIAKRHNLTPTSDGRYRTTPR